MKEQMQAAAADMAVDFLVTVNMKRLARSVCIWSSSSRNCSSAANDVYFHALAAKKVYKQARLPMLLRMTLLHGMELFELEARGRRKRLYRKILRVPSSAAWRKMNEQQQQQQQLTLMQKFLLLTCALNASDKARKNLGTDARKLMKIFQEQLLTFNKKKIVDEMRKVLLPDPAIW